MIRVGIIIGIFAISATLPADASAQAWRATFEAGTCTGLCPDYVVEAVAKSQSVSISSYQPNIGLMPRSLFEDAFERLAADSIDDCSADFPPEPVDVSFGILLYRVRIESADTCRTTGYWLHSRTPSNLAIEHLLSKLSAVWRRQLAERSPQAP